MKYKCNFVFRLGGGPIPKISHYGYSGILKSPPKYLKSKTLLIPCISNKGCSTCLYHVQMRSLFLKSAQQFPYMEYFYFDVILEIYRWRIFVVQDTVWLTMKTLFFGGVGAPENMALFNHKVALVLVPRTFASRFFQLNLLRRELEWQRSHKGTILRTWKFIQFSFSGDLAVETKQNKSPQCLYPVNKRLDSL